MFPCSKVFYKFLCCNLLLFYFCQNQVVFAQQQQIDSLQKILRNAEKRQNYQLDTNYLYQLNNFAGLFRNINPDSMLIWGQKANDLCQKINYTNGILEAIHNIGLAFHLKGDNQRVLIYYKIGLKIAEKANNQKQIAKFYLLMGYAHYDNGESDEGLKLYLKAFKIIRKLGNENDLAKVLHNIALIYLDQASYINALYYCLESMKIAEKIGDKQQMGYLLITLAKIKIRQGHDKEALITNNKSIGILQSIGNEKGVAINLADIGDIYTKQGKYDDALIKLYKSLEIRRKIDDKKGIAYSFTSIAQVYEIQKKYKDAIELYLQALAIKKNISDNSEMPQDFYGSASCYLALKDYQNAINYGLKGLELSKTYNQKSKIRDSYQNLSNIYKIIGNDRLALYYYEQFNVYKDSVNNKDIANKTAELQAKYEYEKKESILISEYKSQQKIQYIFLFTGLLVLICVLGFAFFIFRSRTTLQKAYNSLELANIEIALQKTAIEMQSENLSKVNATKDKLFSIIGHDLRNPIATLKGLLGLVVNDDVSQEEFKIFAPQLERNVNTVHETLENLLQWAYSQMQGMTHLPQKLDIQQIITKNIELVTEIAHSKQITILQNIDTNISIFADENHINLILRNLISNALKFTNEGGSITVATKLANNFIQISVMDTGVGMTAEQVAKLFHTETSFTTYGTNGEKGTGLGLLLCKEMVTVNGGEIWVISKKNEGTTFYFTVQAV